MLFINNDTSKKGNGPEMNPLMKIIWFIGSLVQFCLITSVTTFCLFVILPSGPPAWEFLGASILAAIILFGTVIFIIGLVPKETLDEIIRKIDEEDKKEKEEKEKEK